MDLAGADHPDKDPESKLMGKSLLPIFKGKRREDHEFLYFHFGNNRAVRKGKWKVVSARGGPWELYDMLADRTELKDLSKSKPQIRDELVKVWHDFAEGTDRLSQKQRRPVSKSSQPWRKRG